MSGYVTLMGAEEVGRAASTMSGAASEMNRAAGNIDGALERHQRFLDDWLSRFSGEIDRLIIETETGRLVKIAEQLAQAHSTSARAAGEFKPRNSTPGFSCMCAGCNQAIPVNWTYCAWCGAQERAP